MHSWIFLWKKNQDETADVKWKPKIEIAWKGRNFMFSSHLLRADCRKILKMWKDRNWNLWCFFVSYKCKKEKLQKFWDVEKQPGLLSNQWASKSLGRRQTSLRNGRPGQDFLLLRIWPFCCSESLDRQRATCWFEWATARRIPGDGWNFDGVGVVWPNWQGVETGLNRKTTLETEVRTVGKSAILLWGQKAVQQLQCSKPKAPNSFIYL